MAKVGAILFDEFHERGAEGDLGLSLALDVQRHTHPELRSASLHVADDLYSVLWTNLQCCCRHWCFTGQIPTSLAT